MYMFDCHVESCEDVGCWHDKDRLRRMVAKNKIKGWEMQHYIRQLFTLNNIVSEEDKRFYMLLLLDLDENRKDTFKILIHAYKFGIYNIHGLDLFDIDDVVYCLTTYRKFEIKNAMIMSALNNGSKLSELVHI